VDRFGRFLSGRAATRRRWLAGGAAVLASIFPLAVGDAVRAQQAQDLRAPANASTPAPAASLPEVYSDLYTLGPGDQLQLTFLDPSAKDVGGPVAILPDGTSTLALLGSVQLSGLTLGQATRWLTSLYARQLVRPQLILSLTSARPVQVSVLGEVGRPGLYSFGGGGAAATAFTTPVSAIQTAGGITLNADIRRVILRRVTGPDGGEKQTVLDLAQLLQIGNQRQNPILFDGDTLIVTRAEKPLPSEVIQTGISNLSPATISVTVLGEVKSPGTVAVPSNTPLQEVLMRAGGPTPWRANKGRIELVRLNRNGTTTTEFYEYQPGQDISQGFNPPLRDRDTVIVRRSYYGKTVDLVNELVAPLTSIVNTFYLYGNYNNR
jgi:polysaccharide export outer membrane protein